MVKPAKLQQLLFSANFEKAPSLNFCNFKKISNRYYFGRWKSKRTLLGMAKDVKRQGLEYLLSCGEVVKFWDYATFENEHEVLPLGLSEKCQCFDFNKTDEKLATLPSNGKCLRITESSSQIQGFNDNQIDLNNLNAKITSIRFVKQDLILGGSAGELFYWNSRLSKATKKFTNQGSEITSLAVNGPCSYFASGSIHGLINVHNITSSVVTSLKTSETGDATVKRLCYNPNNPHFLGSVYDDGSVIFWNVNNIQNNSNFYHVHKAPAMDVAFSPYCSKFAATVSLDKKIFLYEVHQKKLLHRIPTDHCLQSVAFSSDGTQLVVGTTKGMILIYDLRVGTIPLLFQTYETHHGAVKQLMIVQFSNVKKNTTPLLLAARLAPNRFEYSSKQSKVTIRKPLVSLAVETHQDEKVSPDSTRNPKTTTRDIHTFAAPLIASHSAKTSPNVSPKSSGSPRNASKSPKSRNQEPNRIFNPDIKEWSNGYYNSIFSPAFDGSGDVKENVEPTHDDDLNATVGNPIGLDDTVPIAIEVDTVEPKIDHQQFDAMKNELKLHVTEIVGDLRYAVHSEYMNLLTKIVKYNVDLQDEVKSLRNECSQNRDLLEEVFRLRDENTKLRTAF